MTNRPRLMIAAMQSGSGKTTVCCALLAACLRRGIALAAFKSGPDYIDPMFHQTVLQTPSQNLDLFFSTPAEVRAQLARFGGEDLTVIEGAMGYYDGIAGKTDQASAWELACVTETPVVLVVDAQKSALTLAAVVKGVLSFRTPHQVQAIVLNRCSPSMYTLLKPLLEAECGVLVAGYLPKLPDCAFESRHLGLVTAPEIADLRAKIDRLGEAFAAHIDIELLLRLAGAAPMLDEPPKEQFVPRSCTIAVAKDDAFCFYYDENLRLLEQFGAELRFFSPLGDAALPQGTNAIYLGGGYPELHAKALADNTAMRQSIREAHRRHVPIFAECGGFQYLQQTMVTRSGERFPMVGILTGESAPTDRLTRFGYLTVTAVEDSFLLKRGESVRAHEFHYWHSTPQPMCCIAQKPHSSRQWEAFVQKDFLFAGYPHLYFPSNPTLAARLVEAAERNAHDSHTA